MHTIIRLLPFVFMVLTGCHQATEKGGLDAGGTQTQRPQPLLEQAEKQELRRAYISVKPEHTDRLKAGFAVAGPAVIQWRKEAGEPVDRAAALYWLALNAPDADPYVAELVEVASSTPVGLTLETDAKEPLGLVLYDIFERTNSTGALAALTNLELDGSPGAALNFARVRLVRENWAALTRHLAEDERVVQWVDGSGPPPAIFGRMLFLEGSDNFLQLCTTGAKNSDLQGEERVLSDKIMGRLGTIKPYQEAD